MLAISAEAESGYSDHADLQVTYGFDLDLTYTDEREKLGEL